MTLLFGASSIALFLLSMLVAIIALIGWHNIKATLDRVHVLEGEVRTKVHQIETTTQARIDLWSAKLETLESDKIAPLESEMKGRVHSIPGYLLGEMSLDRDTLTVKDFDRLKEATDLCQQGYQLLQVRRGDPAEYLALNNSIFFLSFSNDISRSGFLLEQARRLLMAAQEHDSVHLLLTACRVILLFSSDEEEKSTARAILAAIPSKSHAREKDKKEALMYLASFSKLVAP